MNSLASKCVKFIMFPVNSIFQLLYIYYSKGAFIRYVVGDICIKILNGFLLLLLQIKELKAKLHEENTESINLSVKEEIVVAESDDKAMEQSKPAPDSPPLPASDSKDLNFKCFDHNNGVGGATLFRVDFKDGSSDSDSSAILNEDNSPNAAISSSGVLQNQLLMSPSQAASSSSLKFNSSSPMGCFQFQKTFQPQFVKMEEHNFFSGEEACNFFSDEQPPTLQWYCSEQWN